MADDHLVEPIERCVEALTQYGAGLQVLGRALTPAEQRRSELAAAAVEPLRRLREELAEPPAPAPAPVRDGRYAGGNAELFLDLRVDEGVSGVISADVFRNGPSGRQYVASLRTAPGTRVTVADGAWAIIAQDRLGATATGVLRMAAAPEDPDGVSGTFTLDAQLNGLATRREMAFAATWRSQALRTIGVEIETEEGVDPIAPFEAEGGEFTFERSLADAGLAVVPVGLPTPVPPAEGGWDTGQLHTLMTDLAQAPLTRRAWELHLLLLSRATEPRLLGVMFDDTAVLPRQGAAVFAHSIRTLAGANAVRKLIQTTVHELGHGLNLAHRFERAVARADSTSFMNYDWRYRGGGRALDYWSRFAFTFDADELEFLRHAPLSALIPGGAAFHSIPYWIQGEGGYSPYVPEVPLGGLELELRPPAMGSLVRFGQPVFLEVVLTNRTGEPLNLSPALLDVKAGLLEILVKRATGVPDGDDLAGARPFIPILQRCFDLDPGTLERVPDGGSVRNNLNLVYGSSGFPFAEPGTYDVTAVLAVFDEPNERDLIVRSPPLRLRVAHPTGIDDERDAIEMLEPEVGTFLALGGTAALPGVRDRLDAVRERRDPGDPLAAAIARAQAIDATRTYVRFEDGAFHDEAAAEGTAARLLDGLAGGMRVFDACTAEQTRRLAARTGADTG